MVDFNHDGELDSLERALEISFLDEITKDKYEDERREALEDAGLDPDDYDF